MLRIIVFVLGIFLFGFGLLIIQMYPHYAGIRVFWSGAVISIIGIITSVYVLATDPEVYL